MRVIKGVGRASLPETESPTAAVRAAPEACVTHAERVDHAAVESSKRADRRKILLVPSLYVDEATHFWG